MKVSKKYLIIIGGILFLFIAITTINNNPKESVRINGIKYINQEYIVPNEYIEGKIGSKEGFVYYKIKDANEDYQIAVLLDGEYYFYKTKKANEIIFNQ